MQIKHTTQIQHLVAITLFVVTGLYSDFFILLRENFIVDVFQIVNMLLNTVSNVVLIKIFRIWVSSSISGEVVIVKLKDGSLRF